MGPQAALYEERNPLCWRGTITRFNGIEGRCLVYLAGWIASCDNGHKRRKPGGSFTVLLKVIWNVSLKEGYVGRLLRSRLGLHEAQEIL